MAASRVRSVCRSCSPESDGRAIAALTFERSSERQYTEDGSGHDREAPSSHPSERTRRHAIPHLGTRRAKRADYPWNRRTEALSRRKSPWAALEVAEWPLARCHAVYNEC